MITRRSFLGACMVAAAAPAIVSAKSLMPVRQIYAPSSTEAIVARAVEAAMKGEFGVVTLYSTMGEVLARLPVNENPKLGPAYLHTSDFKLGTCGKAVYEHPLLGQHEFQHAAYGMDIPKGATEITVANFKIDISFDA